MNALRRDIKPGELVVHTNGREFVCLRGYGMNDSVYGHKIVGFFVNTAEHEREDAMISGMEDIDVWATNALQKERAHGKRVGQKD